MIAATTNFGPLKFSINKAECDKGYVGDADAFKMSVSTTPSLIIEQPPYLYQLLIQFMNKKVIYEQHETHCIFDVLSRKTCVNF